MDQDAIRKYIARIEAALAVQGPTRAALCDGKGGRQDVRFRVLAAPALASRYSSVLDIGCGFADLYAFLTNCGWRGRYTGIDIVPALLAEARRRHPGIALHERDASAGLEGLPAHDVVVASGVFNLALPHGGNEAHIERLLSIMFDHAGIAVAVDFMTTQVDFRHPDAWHTDPHWALALADRLTRRLVLRADYMPYEFALILYKDVRVSDRTVFRALDP
jgi:trans-aconitate methyltransferase